MSDHVSVPRGTYDLHARTAALLDRLLGDPRTAAQAEELIATVNPEAKFPHREQREALLAPALKALDEEAKKRQALEDKWTAREKAEQEAHEKAQETDLGKRLDAVRDKRGFSEDAMQKLMQRMRDQNNPDVDAAAAWVAEQSPRPGPQVGVNDFLPRTIDTYGANSGDKAWEGLHKNPDGWLTDELRAIAADPEFHRLGNG
jgi:hypothetical protein